MMNTDDKNPQPEEPLEPESKNELEVAKAEAADWRDKYLRKLAEFDNFRKRARQELSMARDMSTEDVVVSMLPVIDDFDRLMQNAESVADDKYHRGVQMVYGKLRAFLESRGIVRFDSVGKPFDPAEHDAMLMQPTPDFPAGTVLAVMAPGYKLGERVIRHAQVIVSAEPELEAGSTDGSAEGTSGK